MERKIVWTALVLAGALAVYGCHDNGNSSTGARAAFSSPGGSTAQAAVPPGTANAQGVFTGTFGQQNATMTLSQSGTSVSGSFAATTPVGTPGTVVTTPSTTLTGSVTGSVSGNAISLHFIPQQTNLCFAPLNATGTINQNTLTFTTFGTTTTSTTTFTNGGNLFNLPVGDVCTSTLTGQAVFTRTVVNTTATLGTM